MKILTSSERKKILNELNETFGIEKFPYLLLRFGKGKIRSFSGSLGVDDLDKLNKNARVEIVGLYTFRQEDDVLRISHDSLYLFKDKIKKNLVKVSDEYADEWLRGNNIDIENQDVNGPILLENNGDLIGFGKSKQGRITNFIPKERRVK